MPRRMEKPVESQDRFGTELNHPAFGQIMLSKVSGARHLYGSDFIHHQYVTIRIASSTLKRGLSHDSYFAGKEYIEVALSEAQWATFVSSFNVGMGVPCTIERRLGEELIPEFPHRDSRPYFAKEISEHLDDTVARLEQTIKTVEEGLKGLSKTKQSEVLQPLYKMLQDLKLNIPYINKQFGEHMEEHVEKAKVEVNAYMTNMIMRSGIEALSGLKVIEDDTEGSDP